MDSTSPLNLPDGISEKASQIARYADDLKAQDLVVLDVRAKTSVTDYFVVCTGTSDTHVNSIVERVVDKMREQGIRPSRTESGGTASGWVLVDFGDVVLNVMREDRRQFFDLETLWSTRQPDPNLL